MKNYDEYDNELDEFPLDFEELLNNKEKYQSEINDILKDIENDKQYHETIREEPIDEATERLKIDKETVEIFIENIKTDTRLKKRYANTMLFILSAQLISVNVIFILRGLEILNYSDLTFNIFVSGALIEVIALVTIVVKYLFNDNISESLNNILEKNTPKNKK